MSVFACSYRDKAVSARFASDVVPHNTRVTKLIIENAFCHKRTGNTYEIFRQRAANASRKISSVTSGERSPTKMWMWPKVQKMLSVSVGIKHSKVVPDVSSARACCAHPTLIAFQAVSLAPRQGENSEHTRSKSGVPLKAFSTASALFLSAKSTNPYPELTPVYINKTEFPLEQRYLPPYFE